jgi:excisionase family DNA binding protein
MPTTKEDVLTTIEAAKLLKASVRTVQLWVEGGQIKAWKTPGGHRRLSRKSVEAMLAHRTQAITQTARAAYEVLAVDDDAIQIELLRHSIDGCTPHSRTRFCRDGYEALIRIGESRPDLLITDLVMPGLDGFRLLKTLEREQSARPMQIIVLTSLTKAELDAQGGLGNGVTLMHKPVNVDSLRALIQAYHHVWQLAGGQP